MNSHSCEVMFDGEWWKVVCGCGWEAWDCFDEQSARGRHDEHKMWAEYADSRLTTHHTADG